MKLLLIDNYDSFTYNLQDYFLQLGVATYVVRNDAWSLEEVISYEPAALVLSPGPGRPANAGNMMALIGYFHDKIPILGICLGHQGIGEFFGARLVNAAVPVHGKTSVIRQSGHAVFSGLPETFKVMRYHSLIIKDLEDSDLVAVAVTEGGELMAMHHKHFPVFGIQFHPESILTEYGLEILKNWVKTFSSKECWTFGESRLYSKQG